MDIQLRKRQTPFITATTTYVGCLLARITRKERLPHTVHAARHIYNIRRPLFWQFLSKHAPPPLLLRGPLRAAVL